MTWKRTLNLTPEYQETKEGKHKFSELATIISGRMKLLNIKCIDWQLITEEFEFIGSEAEASDFDEVMRMLYDYGDEHRIWIQTS
jgi:hypothetical protein